MWVDSLTNRPRPNFTHHFNFARKTSVLTKVNMCGNFFCSPFSTWTSISTPSSSWKKTWHSRDKPTQSCRGRLMRWKNICVACKVRLTAHANVVWGRKWLAKDTEKKLVRKRCDPSPQATPVERGDTSEREKGRERERERENEEYCIETRYEGQVLLGDNLSQLAKKRKPRRQCCTNDLLAPLCKVSVVDYLEFHALHAPITAQLSPTLRWARETRRKKDGEHAPTKP